MNIALIGARGNIGQAIAHQLLQRGHALTALLRPGSRLPDPLRAAREQEVDIFDVAALTEAIRGQDVLASAYGPAADHPETTTEMTRALIAAARAAGVKRVVLVGGAGSLEVAPGVQLVDIPQFPAEYKAVALAHREGLRLLQQASDLDWTFFSPAAQIGPGAAKGGYQLGVGQLLSDAEGVSAIHYPDYAEAFVTELETAAHPQAVITVAYQ